MSLSLLLLAGCATFNQPANLPVAVGARPMGQLMPPDVGGDTAVALAFSGGGTRAAAFSFGVLRGLDHLPTRDGRSYLDRVIFVSGVSGGSVTAAYYGQGCAALTDFRERFLIRDAEEDLNTTVSLGNIARGLHGGANDASRLPAWLDRNLFNHATSWRRASARQADCLDQCLRSLQPNPFLFSPETFAALCSDLSKYPLSNAVAASAAVPVAFVPIVLESFPTACATPLPPWVNRVIADPNSGAQVRAFAEALTHYREPGQIEYLKLADGGITDNFGLSGLVIARAAADRPYLPLTPEKAVRLRRVIFVVVNAGQAPAGNWAIPRRPIRRRFAQCRDGHRGELRRSQRVRCLSLKSSRLGGVDTQMAMQPPRRRSAAARGVGRLALQQLLVPDRPGGFDLFDPQRAAKLSSIPTRLKLPTDDVDLLI